MSKNQRLIIEITYFSDFNKFVEVASKFQFHENIKSIKMKREKSLFKNRVLLVETDFEHKDRFNFFIDLLEQAKLKYR